MSKLSWEQRNYEAGLDRGVLYPNGIAGEAWNGLVSVTEIPSGADAKPLYVDGKRVFQRRTRESFAGSISAFTHPDSFYEDVLTQKRPKSFGLSYRVGAGKNHKIHLVYNVLVNPSAKQYAMSETQPFVWGFTTLPVSMAGGLFVSHVVVDIDAYEAAISDLEDILYGTDETLPRLPLPDEVVEIFEGHSILRVTDHGDGTYTIDGPSEAVIDNGDGTFELNWPSVVVVSSDVFRVSSL